MKKTIIMVFGAPCSGKSVISRKCAEECMIDYISSGDIARSMGEDVIVLLNNGGLAPEDAMRDAIYKAIEHSDNDIIILDGFPRFENQMEWLEKYFVDYDLIGLLIDCDKEILIERNERRGRSDSESFETRYKYFMLYTLPILIKREWCKILYNNGDYTIDEMVDIMRRRIINEIRGDK